MKIRGKITQKYLLVAVFVLLLCGCGNLALKPDEYVKWIENRENNLKVEKKIGDTKFILQYKPVQYMVFSEERKLELDKSFFLKRVDELNSMQYYSLRILPSESNRDVLTMGISSEQDYFTRVNYFSFDFQNDIKLLEGNDTLSCSQFLFVNNYGLAPYADFVLAFQRQPEEQRQDKATSDKELIVDDKVFGNGLIRFIIEKESIDNIPKVLIN